MSPLPMYEWKGTRKKEIFFKEQQEKTNQLKSFVFFSIVPLILLLPFVYYYACYFDARFGLGLLMYDKKKEYK